MISGLRSANERLVYSSKDIVIAAGLSFGVMRRRIAWWRRRFSIAAVTKPLTCSTVNAPGSGTPARRTSRPGKCGGNRSCREELCWSCLLGSFATLAGSIWRAADAKQSLAKLRRPIWSGCSTTSHLSSAKLGNCPRLRLVISADPGALAKEARPSRSQRACPYVSLHLGFQNGNSG